MWTAPLDGLVGRVGALVAPALESQVQDDTPGDVEVPEVNHALEALSQYPVTQEVGEVHRLLGLGGLLLGTGTRLEVRANDAEVALDTVDLQHRREGLVPKLGLDVLADPNAHHLMIPHDGHCRRVDD